MTETYLRVGEVMTRLGVSRRTIGRMMRDGELSFVRVKGTIFIGEAQCDRILLGTPKGTEPDLSTVRVESAVAAEIRKMVGTALNAGCDLVEALNDLGSYFDEAPIRDALAVTVRAMEIVVMQGSRYRVSMPQTLADLDVLSFDKAVALNPTAIDTATIQHTFHPNGEPSDG